jgi:hypothetical protein
MTTNDSHNYNTRVDTARQCLLTASTSSLKESNAVDSSVGSADGPDALDKYSRCSDAQPVHALCITDTRDGVAAPAHRCIDRQPV